MPTECNTDLFGFARVENRVSDSVSTRACKAVALWVFLIVSFLNVRLIWP